MNKNQWLIILGFVCLLGVAAVSTTSVMVNSSTKVLVNPTNFFVANSNLLNQAVLAGDGGSSFDTNYFTTNAAGITVTNHVMTNITQSITLTAFDRFVPLNGDTSIITLPVSDVTNGHFIKFSVIGNGGLGDIISNSIAGGVITNVNNNANSLAMNGVGGGLMSVTLVKRGIHWLIFDYGESNP